ncbi:hypothetical protein DZG01_29705 [Pseudomonas fluorescens]|nr:hypothetical protein DZG01_29705 [Pseudomonas fluorescens]
MGASLLAKAPDQPALKLTDPPPSRASPLPQDLHQRSPRIALSYKSPAPSPTAFLCTLLYGFRLNKHIALEQEMTTHGRKQRLAVEKARYLPRR